MIIVKIYSRYLLKHKSAINALAKIKVKKKWNNVSIA
jgi:hypothetical protein